MDGNRRTDLKIRRVAVANPEASTPTVEMTLADHEYIDDATQIIVASVRIPGNEDSMERNQIAALRTLRRSLDDLATELENKLAAASAPQQRTA